ncbi:MAG: hypothetical protein ABJF11_06610 [Reichenbachiella sp.]|uniref:hypothetical protein n=1 Tax=Reichenbachiella sp. TaxID=2184521 RepID=UPI003264C6B8
MEDHLPHYQIRPRFRIATSISPEQIREKLTNAISKSSDSIGGTVITGHATITLPEKDQHYWSPQLTLSFEALDGENVLRGMYSPRPAVWTMFVLFYSIIGFATLVISIMGYSFWSLGQSAAILWAVPVLLVIFLSLYLVSFLGQRTGKKQMIALHSFVEDTLEIKILGE